MHSDLSGLLTNGGTSLYPEALNAPPLRTYAPPWFNTCTITLTGGRQNCLGADEPAAWKIQPAYTLNAISPRFANLRNLRPPLADVSLFKGFDLPREGMKFEIIAQAFNVTNTPWFGAGATGAGVTTNVHSPSFGKVIFAQGNDPRTVQFAAKIVF